MSLNKNRKNVVIIGAGISGLTAAKWLSRWPVDVTIVEQSAFAGGIAARLTCKAVDGCVKCGACMVAETYAAVACQPNIRMMTGTRIEQVEHSGTFSIRVRRQPGVVDTQRCNGCGQCLAECPAQGALEMGWAGDEHPTAAILAERCRHLSGDDCHLCADICPEDAIDLDLQGEGEVLNADAVVAATGFAPYDPSEKAFGYDRFDNVITNLEAEDILRRAAALTRPSDGGPARRVAFVQCVGSRDAAIGHKWCSQVCCGSALRMANKLMAQAPDTQVTFFYMDVQTFGKDFQPFYQRMQDRIRMVRSIPVDIDVDDRQRPLVTYFSPAAQKNESDRFDLVVLSIGLTPQTDARQLAGMLGGRTDENGFWAGAAPRSLQATGVFAAGTAVGPMGIAQSVASAEQTAWQVLQFLTPEGQDSAGEARDE